MFFIGGQRLDGQIEITLLFGVCEDRFNYPLTFSTEHFLNLCRQHPNWIEIHEGRNSTSVRSKLGLHPRDRKDRKFLVQPHPISNEGILDRVYSILKDANGKLSISQIYRGKFVLFLLSISGDSYSFALVVLLWHSVHKKVPFLSFLSIFSHPLKLSL